MVTRIKSVLPAEEVLDRRVYCSNKYPATLRQETHDVPRSLGKHESGTRRLRPWTSSEFIDTAAAKTQVYLADVKGLGLRVGRCGQEDLPGLMVLSDRNHEHPDVTWIRTVVEVQY
jgi:hypothetical protein